VRFLGVVSRGYMRERQVKQSASMAGAGGKFRLCRSNLAMGRQKTILKTAGQMNRYCESVYQNITNVHSRRLGFLLVTSSTDL
jgi:hypothetical protein